MLSWLAELLAWRSASKHRRLLTGSDNHEVTADAPIEPTALGHRTAGLLPRLLHRPHLHHLLRAGLRVLGPARPAHRLWHAHRRPPPAGLAPQPRPPLLRRSPLVSRPARPGPARPDRGGPCPCRRAGASGGRRHPVSPLGPQGLWGRLAPRPARPRAAPGRLGQQLGHTRRAGRPADAAAPP